MSGISGSCTESPSRALFEQGIQKLQEAKLENDSTEEQQKSGIVSNGAENTPSITEGVKGSLFDDFA
ncbi:MAG: hypothetical protein OEX19_01775 [Gammaproteobacteria bacterium]|nr:hypothetical protein [Gammaproteobacteria bacterium]